MFKFLRKYNKWILAVGGTLLMIVFLIPQAIQGLSQRAAVGGSVWATMAGEEITGETRQEYEKQIEILDTLQRATPNLGITNEADHWFLLVKEAEAAGLVGGRGSDQLPSDVMALYFNVASSVASPPTVDRAIGNRLAVDRLFRLYQGAAKLSDGRLRREAEKMFHSADVRSVMIEAKARDEDPSPPADALQTQYEAYKDLAPGEGDKGFGYRLPDRVKIEWLTVPRDSVRALVETTDGNDGVALVKHWQRNQVAKGFPTYTAGAEVPEVVRADYLDTRAGEMLDRIERFANDQLLTSRRRLETLDAYYVLPENWSTQQLALSTLATNIQAEFAGLALPSYEAIGDRWIEVSKIATIEGLAGATTDKFTGQSTPLTTLVAATKELTADPGMLVQSAIAGPPLRLADRSIVLFRLTAVEPARAPTDLDEVRDLVVADVKRQRDYERLLTQADAWLTQAKQEGLLAVAMSEDVELQRIEQVTPFNTFLLNFQLQNNLPVTPQPSTLPIIGPHTETIHAIIDNALALPNDRPLLDIPAAERTYLEAIDDKLVIMIYEIVGETPFAEDQYTQLVSGGVLQRLLLNEELSAQNESIIDVFSRDALASRHQFKLRARPTTDDDETTAGVGP